MPRITFIEHNGKEHHIEANVGQSLMQVAVNNGVTGILADCGGNRACATCHVYVDGAWIDKIAPAEKAEQEMVECTLHTRENSRLSCQITVTPQLDGLVLRLPQSQI